MSGRRSRNKMVTPIGDCHIGYEHRYKMAPGEDPICRINPYTYIGNIGRKKKEVEK